MEKLIGLSLSMCVKDIVEGRVELSDVQEICSGTKAILEEDWDYLVCAYSKTYWKGNSIRARQVVDFLRGMDRITQPRVEGKDGPNTGGGWWVEVPG